MSKIALPIAELKPALTGLGKVISKRSTLPVISHIKIERTKDGWIALTSTDLDSFVTVRLEQPSEGEPTSLLVPYDELLKITRSCQKADTLLLRSGENTSGPSVIIEYAIGGQVAEAKTGSLPVEEFPEIPRIKGDPIPIGDAVRASIHEAMECASTDETRLILNGAYIDTSNANAHYVVGTDGRHLFSSNSFSLPLKQSLIIPNHRFLGFKEFNSDGEWALKLGTSHEKDIPPPIQISSRRWRFITRQIEGNYPNWRAVVPASDQFVTSISVDQEQLKALADTIDRLPEHDLINHTIGIERKGHDVNLLWKPDRDQGWKRLAMPTEKLTGKDVTIYLNRHLLSKALRFGLHQIDCIEPMAPLRFSNEGRQMIVMPLRAQSTPTAGPQAQETPSQPAASPAAQEERTPMVNDTTTNGASTTAEPVTIDTQLDQLIADAEAMRTVVQDHLADMKSLCTKLKSIQREHKSSTKELQSVRQTLKGLQGLKL